jgi:Fe-S oxidoreductase
VLVRLIAGLLMTAVGLAFAGRRIHWLYRLVRSGQPDTRRSDELGTRLALQLREVFGQRKLLKWTVPGLAHFFTFWGFVILASVYLEAYGSLFDKGFHIWWIGRWPVLGFLQDFIAVAVAVSLAVFAVIRIRQAPERKDRASRFYGSHTGGAWLILFMIFNVVWTMFLFRGSSAASGTFPYRSGAWVSLGVGDLLRPLGTGTTDVLETVGLLLHIGVMLVFLGVVLYSKHLHIFLAPINVAFSRRPRALGALLPVYSGGKEVDFEDPGEDDKIGRGVIEDFTWKGMLDFATCTECGRCQSQCPAWNTEKPLSPKLLIMSLRDHAAAKAPYLLATSDEQRAALHKDVLAEAERSLVGPVGEGGVIDPDVLWSCVTCGACVEQCPVDIEHVDHIVDMRRYQVLIESQFPKEAHTLLRNLERAGDPWGRGAQARLEWMAGLPFDVRVLDEGQQLPDDVEYLLWVGCAGSLDENAKKTTRAVAELLNEAGVSFMVLGGAETCTGDAARRLGQELLFQELGKQNVETLNNAGAKRIVVTCAHCFNALGNEYRQLGGDYEVLHHTQLLSQLIAEKRLVPVHPVDAAVTYHDPCYLGRHNRVFSPPRSILAGVPGVRLTEMPRNRETSFCCGAGGARMWMEETIGVRINETRTDEALATGAELITAACPYCIVMLTDGTAVRKQQGKAADEVQVVDVSRVLLRSIVDPR